MKVLITGGTGMVGSHLADLLLEKGYDVHIIVRPTATPNTRNIAHILDRVTLHYGDLCDYASLITIIRKVQPDEVYNMAAQTHAGTSFKVPLYTHDVTSMGVLRLLEIIRTEKPNTKFWQASTSESLDKTAPLPWNEDTPQIKISNPYGISKADARRWVEFYREVYGIFAVNGIMFNNESPRRGEEFVTRKISLAAARIKKGLQSELLLGNIEAKRDWGYSPNYALAAWMMLQNKEPKDYVIATGESHTVREWMEECFKHVGLNAYDYYKEDERFMRPSDIPDIIGDTTRIKNDLGWEPTKRFHELTKIMVEADL